MRSAEVQVALERNAAHVAMKAQLTTFFTFGIHESSF